MTLNTCSLAVKHACKMTERHANAERQRHNSCDFCFAGANVPELEEEEKTFIRWSAPTEGCIDVNQLKPIHGRRESSVTISSTTQQKKTPLFRIPSHIENRQRLRTTAICSGRGRPRQGYKGASIKTRGRLPPQPQGQTFTASSLRTIRATHWNRESVRERETERDREKQRDKEN